MTLTFCGQAVRLRCPASLCDAVGVMFGALQAEEVRTNHEIVAAEEADGRFSIACDRDPPVTGLTHDAIPGFLMERVVWGLTEGMTAALALHAGAVALNGRAILVAGPSGAGKSSLVAWFIANGFDYLSDEITALAGPRAWIAGLPRAIVSKGGATEAIARMAAFRDAASVPLGGGATAWTAPAMAARAGQCRLLVFPRYAPGVAPRLEPATAAQAGLRLLACNVNARNLRGDGFAEVTALAQAAPAVVLTYGDFSQLEGVFDAFCRLLLGESPDAGAVSSLSAAHFRALIGCGAAERLLEGITGNLKTIA